MTLTPGVTNPLQALGISLAENLLYFSYSGGDLRMAINTYNVSDPFNMRSNIGFKTYIVEPLSSQILGQSYPIVQMLLNPVRIIALTEGTAIIQIGECQGNPS